ncbi:uncharacterized protein LOC111499795 isoform X2 [Cucurbita maxima]|uniref:Uncharacterized protein LOC111499795 isoform X2 n=1 Tax=Cucurbita maxima TaxID=3661 RepID=A0A6J1L017_CUCMA|nr:uncharacterized protein LOC111499795 isoform X2 [Cucurbita maxima]
MFNFEDELIIQPRVSWLIWIQLLLLILVFALYCLTIFAIDFSKINTDSNSTAAIPSSSSSTSTSRFVSEIAHNHKNVSMHNIRIDSDPSRNAQVNIEQSTREEIASSMSRRIRQTGEGSVVGGEGCKETKLEPHPRSYFRLAKSAFLRCVGLDSSTANSVPEERQRPESTKSKRS